MTGVHEVVEPFVDVLERKPDPCEEEGADMLSHLLEWVLGNHLSRCETVEL